MGIMTSEQVQALKALPQAAKDAITSALETYIAALHDDFIPDTREACEDDDQRRDFDELAASEEIFQILTNEKEV